MQTPFMPELHLAMAIEDSQYYTGSLKGRVTDFRGTYQSERKEEEGNNDIFRRENKEREK